MDYAVPNAKIYFSEKENAWYWERNATMKECYWLPPNTPIMNGPFASAAEAIADCRENS